MTERRKHLGRSGEAIAAAVLADRGVEIIDRNVSVGRGEVDLVVRSAGRRILVEVRSVHGELRLDQRFPEAKRRQLRFLASELGIHRLDLVGVAFGSAGVTVHWLRDVATD